MASDHRSPRKAPRPRDAWTSSRSGVHRQITRFTWLLPIPGLALALGLLWSTPYSLFLRCSTTVVLLALTGLLGFLLRTRLAYSHRTLANVVAALRDGDFSIRPHLGHGPDPLGALAAEIHALGETLRDQRLGALEASNLLRTALDSMEAAVFTFDDRQCLRFANRAAERLLARPVEQLLQRTASQLHLDPCLEGPPARVLSLSFPGTQGRFGIRRSGFRQDGRPHQLLVLTDLSRALREEERQAWQRLVRVLGHELNNSLAPIKSVASSLEQLCRRDPRPPDWETDMRDGLALISARAEALNRFMQAYSQLARLPSPNRVPLPVAPWLRRAASLEHRIPVELVPGPEVSILADSDQLDQLLINLVRNAADAVLESPRPTPPDQPAPVSISWSATPSQLEVRVEDFGPGIANPANLFVPFFTTKPKGSGIGLSLCRQIAEAHDGQLTVENHPSHHGCLARLRLPLPTPDP